MEILTVLKYSDLPRFFISDCLLTSTNFDLAEFLKVLQFVRVNYNLARLQLIRILTVPSFHFSEY